MHTEYDFSRLKRRKIKITISLDPAVVRFFKEKAREEGVGYQTLINEALKRLVEEEPREGSSCPFKTGQALLDLHSLHGYLLSQGFHCVIHLSRRRSKGTDGFMPIFR